MLACLCLKFDLGHIDRTRNYKLCSTAGTAGPKYFPVIWLQPGRGRFRTSTSLRCTKRGHKSQGYSVDTEKKGIQCPCCYDWIVPDRDKKKGFLNIFFFKTGPKVEVVFELAPASGARSEVTNLLICPFFCSIISIYNIQVFE